METALLRVQNDILCEIDNQKCVILLLLDMSAAFDTVDHKLLLERKAKGYGVKGNALKWFRSYLQERKQFVMIDGTKTEIHYGVPQGSVLGPILYLLYSTHHPSRTSSNSMDLITIYMLMTPSFISHLSPPILSNLAL